MNKTEERARTWLIGEVGYSPEDIVFRSTKSPDFVLADGISVEVKRVTGKTLTIPEYQWLDLQNCQNCLIAIFDNVCVVPKALIPVKGLKPPATWGEYTIKVSPDGMAKWRFHLRILSELKDRGLTREQFRTEYREKHKLEKAELILSIGELRVESSNPRGK